MSAAVRRQTEYRKRLRARGGTHVSTTFEPWLLHGMDIMARRLGTSRRSPVVRVAVKELLERAGLTEASLST